MRCAFWLGRLGPTTGFGLIALGLWVPSDLELPGRVLGPTQPVLNNLGSGQESLVPIPGSLKPQYYFPRDWVLSQEN